VAALVGEATGTYCLNETQLPARERTAQSLAPGLREMLRQVDWPAQSIELVSVTVGPGSFTGLRIGVTTAKALAYALGAQIIGVDTLEVLAAQAPAAAGRLWTIVDAQRQELFAASFEFVGAAARRTSATQIMHQEKWLAGLEAGDRVIGPALERLAARLPAHVLALPTELWQPTAAAVGQVAWRAYQAGRRDDVWKLLPNYFRPSAAEEKLRHT
jgi:tRNA threonylcarbamoyladenosine biosynthesis protein TsaB